MAGTAQQGFSGNFADPYNFDYSSYYNNSVPGVDPALAAQGWTGESGISSFFQKLVGRDVDQAKQNRIRQADIEYERQSINSARAWDEYMDSTKYQRAVNDLKAAGLNPWLAVQNGMPGTGSASVDTGGSASHQTKSDQSMSGLAALLMALAKILAA